MKISRKKFVPPAVVFPEENGSEEVESDSSSPIRKLVNKDTTFPIFHKTGTVVSTFQDSPFTTHKVHLADSGSCRVPKGHTITLYEWRKQNGYE